MAHNQQKIPWGSVILYDRRNGIKLECSDIQVLIESAVSICHLRDTSGHIILLCNTAGSVVKTKYTLVFV